jgi:biopolymer transport protein TolQ
MNPSVSLSVWQLVTHASLVVQLVMLLLLAASVYSWTLIFQRRSIYGRAQASAESFENQFWSGTDLQALYQQVTATPDHESGCENIFRAGLREFLRLREKHLQADAVMQGVTRAMRIALSHEQTRLEASLSFLASVGSTSPYVGLFGTVIGIMTSFIGLANVHQASLSVVAPGIAEALIATAMGLFAAIPAVLAYNRFASISDSLLSRYETFADEFTSILHRESHGRPA